MQQDRPEQSPLDGQIETDAQQDDSTSQEVSLALLEEQLEAEQHKSEEYLDLLRRTQADFVNYKRRVSQEQAEVRVIAQAALIELLLPMLDDLGRALESAPSELAHHPWVEGIHLVEKRLMTTLEQIGVHSFGKPGDIFDPRWHDALTTQSRPDVAEGVIVSVIRPGYAFGDRVIRPAQVIVAGSPQDS